MPRSIRGDQSQVQKALLNSEQSRFQTALEGLVFVGFNSRVVALDRDTGTLVWEWKSPAGSGYVAVLVDGDRLIVSVKGYTYCLMPHNGRILWQNSLEGLGTGVPCLASLRGNTAGVTHLLAAAADEEAAAASAAAAGGAGA